jgi:hypothetical protein
MLMVEWKTNRTNEEAINDVFLCINLFCSDIVAYFPVFIYIYAELQSDTFRIIKSNYKSERRDCKRERRRRRKKKTGSSCCCCSLSHFNTM